MDRSVILFATAFSSCFVAFIFIIIALATNEWLVFEMKDGTSFKLGLWKYCLVKWCEKDVVTVPAVLAVITMVLTFVSLLTTLILFIPKRFSSNFFFIPIPFLFLSTIFLIADLAVIWHELPNRNIPKEIETEVLGLDPSTLNMGQSGLNTADLIPKVLRALAKQGFSVILMITALTLLIFSLVASTLAATFRKTEDEQARNHPIASNLAKH